jgi:Na+/H+ antiporter NhaC
MAAMDNPGLLSLLPALLAVTLALATRNVVLSLAVACWSAATILLLNPLTAIVHVVDPWLVESMADSDNMKVILFSLFVAGTVGILSKGKGTDALVRVLVKLARTRRTGMFTTWLAGMLVFFDDYANCLIVGSSMRALSDRLKISREKLAYIVDSTAAPIASLALVSTWIGYEVGLMDQGLEAAGQDIEAYAFFVEGIGYRFYSLFTIVFVGAIAITGRDFGPMRKAEALAAKGLPTEGSLTTEAPVQVDDPKIPLSRALLAVLPIATLLFVTGFVLFRDGLAGAPDGARFFEVLGAADGYVATLKGSLAGLLVAAGLALAMRALTLKQTFNAGLTGMTGLFEALVVLFFAWALGTAMGELGAADYLVGVLGDRLPASGLPTAVFLVAAATAFATGSSFGTMGIVMPIVIPLSFALSDDPMIPLAASGAVLSGACWGDHCSPISDTTILSSIGAGCEVTAHVKTQLPYALACGTIAVFLGTVPAGMGVPLWIVVPLGMAACVATVWFSGKRPDQTTDGPSDTALKQKQPAPKQA